MVVLMIKNFLLILVLALAWGVMGQQTVITQRNISWFVQGSPDTGRFINGDPWVVGPITLDSINPPSVNHRNGSMINPHVSSVQGYDSRITYSSTYDSAVNIANRLNTTNPLSVAANSSIISTISKPDGADRPYLQSAEILTVLSEVPPDSSFRPSFSSELKTIKYTVDSLRLNILPRKTSVDSIPDKVTILNYVNKPWIDHASVGYMWQYMAPEDNVYNYGREIASTASKVALYLCTNQPDSDLKDVAINIVQVGIDLYGIATSTNGKNRWIGGGGHNSGRKLPILLAGYLLSDTTFYKIDTIAFQEDQQTYYELGWTGDSVLWAPNHITRTKEDYEHKHPSLWTVDGRGLEGDPEWGSNSDYRAESYRMCCNGSAWIGEALAIRLLNATHIWKHQPFFDYCVRWQNENYSILADTIQLYTGNDIESNKTWPSQFVTDMWDAHWSAPTRYSINKTITGDGQIRFIPDYTSYDSASVIMVIANPNYGSVFSHMSGDIVSDNDTVTIKIQSDMSVDVVFTEINNNISNQTIRTQTFVVEAGSEYSDLIVEGIEKPKGAHLTVMPFKNYSEVDSGWLLSVGACDSARQFTMSTYAENAPTDSGIASNTSKMLDTLSCIRLKNVCIGVCDTILSNGIRVYWTTPPTKKIVIGVDFYIGVQEFRVGNTAAGNSSVTMGFSPDFVVSVGAGTPMVESANNMFTYGISANGVSNPLSISMQDRNGRTTTQRTQVASLFSMTDDVKPMLNDTVYASSNLTFTENGFDRVTTKNTFSTIRVGYMAVKLNGQVVTMDTVSISGGGLTNINRFGFDAQFIKILPTVMSVPDYSNPKIFNYWSVCLGSIDDYSQWSMQSYSQDYINKSVTRQRVDTSIYLYNYNNDPNDSLSIRYLGSTVDAMTFDVSDYIPDAKIIVLAIGDTAITPPTITSVSPSSPRLFKTFEATGTNLSNCKLYLNSVSLGTPTSATSTTISDTALGTTRGFHWLIAEDTLTGLRCSTSSRIYIKNTQLDTVLLGRP